MPVQRNLPEPAVALVAALACVDSKVAALVSKLGAAAHCDDAARALAADIAALTAELFERTGVDVLRAVLEAVRTELSTSFDRDVCGALLAHLARKPGDTTLRDGMQRTTAGDALYKLRAALARFPAHAGVQARAAATLQTISFQIAA